MSTIPNQIDNIEVFPDVVTGLVHEPMNVTISHENEDEEEFCWTATTTYITPAEGESNCFVLGKQNPNHTISMSSSLIGIFKVRF